MLVSLFDLPCCESEREILGLRELGVRMSVQKEAIAGPKRWLGIDYSDRFYVCQKGCGYREPSRSASLVDRVEMLVLGTSSWSDIAVVDGIVYLRDSVNGKEGRRVLVLENGCEPCVN
jgi:hypothetical protein